MQNNNENDEFIFGATKLQNKMMISLNQTTKMIKQSKEIGKTTLDVLQTQKHQINEIGIEVKTMDDNMEKSINLIKKYSKTLISDKFIQLLFFLIVVISCIIIIYVVIKTQKK